MLNKLTRLGKSVLLLFLVIIAVCLVINYFYCNKKTAPEDADCAEKNISYKNLGYDPSGALYIKAIIPRCLKDAEKYGLYDAFGDKIPTTTAMVEDTVFLLARFPCGTAPSCYALSPSGAIAWKEFTQTH